MAWLDDNPPKRYQFRDRRAKHTGLIVVHSAENLPDVNPPDTGAEDVARFIQNRTDAGSYHWLCDSDSKINLVDMRKAAFGDGTGSNEYGIHVSGAFKAHQWPTLSTKWRHGCIDEMAAACWESMTWLKSKYDISVPLRRVTRSQSEAGWPGFISHGERDPGRRSDPGPEFSWSLLLEALRPEPAFTSSEEDMDAIIEMMKIEYRKRRGLDYDPSTQDRDGWYFWMQRLATGTDVHGNKADSWTIFQGFLWIINAGEGPGKF